MPHWSHNWQLQALFDALVAPGNEAVHGEPLTPEAAITWLENFLRLSWTRIDGTEATYVQMTPGQPDGWHLTCDVGKLYIVRPDESRWPASHVVLADRVFMEGPDGPRRGKPLMGGRPNPVIIAGPPAFTVVEDRNIAKALQLGVLQGKESDHLGAKQQVERDRRLLS